MTKKFVDILLILLDFLFISFVFFTFTKNKDLLNDINYLNSSLVIFFIIMLSLLYEKIHFLRYDFWEETRIIIRSLILSFFIIFFIFSLDKFSHHYDIKFLILYFTILCFALPVFKRFTKKIIFHTPHLRKRVKIIGNKEQVEILSKEFKLNWYLGLKVVKKSPKAVYIASKDINIKKMQKYVRKYSFFVKNIYIIPYLDSVNLTRSTTMELFNIKTSLIKIENNLLKIENIVIKDIFEKLLIIMILPFFTIIHIIISLLIIKDSKGNILFKQKRLGKNGKIFKCYKYRTMIENGDSVLKEYLDNNPEEKELYNIYHKYTNDPRVTKIGKILRALSLDELPQIINVLKGEMSLIGPRPYMKEECVKLENSKDLILRVKPGISGLWQVSGRNELSFEHRKSLDKWYIQNWSIWMDIVILMKTFKVVLLKVGAK